MQETFDDARQLEWRGVEKKKACTGQNIVMLLVFLAAHGLGYIIGFCQARSSEKDTLSNIPSCIYIQRPDKNAAGPWGYDNKEGVDWQSHALHGGGYFISLERITTPDIPYHERH